MFLPKKISLQRNLFFPKEMNPLPKEMSLPKEKFLPKSPF
jgi:hypothetical protein